MDLCDPSFQAFQALKISPAGRRMSAPCTTLHRLCLAGCVWRPSDQGEITRLQSVESRAANEPSLSFTVTGATAPALLLKGPSSAFTFKNLLKDTMQNRLFNMVSKHENEIITNGWL